MVIKIYKLTLYLLLILVITIFNTASVFAGTGQIFSPSGLPQSSTQTYSPPTPSNTPTVTFPTPPLPLGEGVLQGFPGASVPLNTTSQGLPAATQGGTTEPQPTLTPATNSVESFFKCPPTTAQKAHEKESPVKSAGKFVWHVLDNLGVPLPVNKDSDLDPSLRQPYVMPLPKTSSQIIIPPTPQKIPESELEGTDVSPAQDNKSLPLH
jgi:hypothetical protein